MEKCLWARAVIQILWQRIMERRYAVQAPKYILKVYQNHTCCRRGKAILDHYVILDHFPSFFIHERDGNPYYISELMVGYLLSICLSQLLY